MTDQLLSWRDHFPILQETTYLVSHSLGAMPRGVYDSLHDYADIWARRGVRAWGDAWFELNRQVGNKIARIISAPQNTITMHENLSIALSILVSAMEFRSGRDKIVLDEMTFPTDYYVLAEMLPHMRLERVPSSDGISVSLERLLDAIDERTGFVLVNHVLFRSGYIMPLAQIIEKAHAVGARVLVDAYHSVGIIPVDVTALDVDYLIGGTLKWMCGGPGGVFMYIRPDLLPTLKPRITGWFAHKRPFSFEVDAIDWRDDSYRMLNGTFGVASLYAVQPGMDIIAQVGVSNIRAKSKRQTALLVELALAAGYEVRSPTNPEERGGMVTIVPPHAYEVSRELLARNILIDYRENAGIRVAPHFYNTDDEIRQVISTTQDILHDGSWQLHAASRDFIT